MKDNINIVEYDSHWVEIAAEEIAKLKQIFKDKPWVLAIEHVGSTAVPGLAAKPIVDIYVGVKKIEDAQQAIEPIEQLGYKFWPDNPNKEKMFFVKGMPPFGMGRTHHIHIVQYNSDYWRARILFRDYLRSHTAEAQKYMELKYKLMQMYSEDREAYTNAKFDFIQATLQKAGFKEKVRR